MSARDKKVIINIDESGNASIEGHGFEGVECEKLIKEINSALGVEVSTQKKREYNQTVSVNRNQKIGR